MKQDNVKSFKRIETPDVVATTIKKDELFNKIANEIFSKRVEIEGEADTLMCLEEKSLKLHMDDSTVEIVGFYDAATASGFKAAYGHTLKAAICKAEYIEYQHDNRIWIWAKNMPLYSKYGWTNS